MYKCITMYELGLQTPLTHGFILCHSACLSTCCSPPFIYHTKNWYGNYDTIVVNTPQRKWYEILNGKNRKYWYKRWYTDRHIHISIGRYKKGYVEHHVIECYAHRIEQRVLPIDKPGVCM